MRYRLIVAFGLLVLTSGVQAQAEQSLAPHRQPRSATQEAGAAPAPGLIDLDATRKRFDANAAKQAESDRKRDKRLNQSMRSICAGCDAAPANGKRTFETGKARSSKQNAAPSE